MGIRLKLSMGYALQVTQEEGKIIWDRINEEQKFVDTPILDWMRKDTEEDANSTAMTSYICANALSSKESSSVMYNLIQYDPEFGFDDIVLMRPPDCKSWERYGDILDTYNYEVELSGTDGFMCSDIRYLKTPIYPYSGKLMKPNPDMPYGIEFYWEPCYLDKDDGIKHIPYVDLSIWYYIKYLGIANSDEEITQMYLSMRPAIMRTFC